MADETRNDDIILSVKGVSRRFTSSHGETLAL